MPIPDDERFEAYLKQFQPQIPKPLPTRVSTRPSRRGILMACAATVAVIGTAALYVHREQTHVTETAGSRGTAPRYIGAQPLTARSANAMLATAPSYKALVDEMAFRSEAIQPPKGKLSAVAVLAKEKINP